MARRRAAPTRSLDPAPQPQPAGARPRTPEPSGRAVLRGWPLRLAALAAFVKVGSPVVGRLAPGPIAAAWQWLANLATVALAVAGAVLLWRGLGAVRRRLLWRVRRKLILSYIFIGFVPTLLVAVFFLFGAQLLFMNVSAYLFRDGYDDLVRQVNHLAGLVEVELRARDASPRAVVERQIEQVRLNLPDLSIAVLPVADGTARPPVAVAGPWAHVEPPAELPAWLWPDGFAGTLAYKPEGSAEGPELLIRAVALPGPGGRYAVVVDLPLTEPVKESLRTATGVRPGAVSLVGAESGLEPLAGRRREGLASEPSVESPEPSGFVAFRHSVALFDYTDWATGRTAAASVRLTARPGSLYDRISRAQRLLAGGLTLGQVFLVVLAVVAVLFLLIEAAALVMGFALARSITGSVHALFVGTERVRRGDFSHRIVVKSRDQLGELAESFNEMTSSIEELLQQAAEKRRLEEELRIAREIQMSLLPRGPVAVPGLEVSAICVPAREVGGDYYDFFRLGERRLGVLIADVAGKGTSAALYMAEVKGLVLSLSQVYESPRRLLIEANRLLAGHLDSRSFITMTYAVVDLEAGLLTHARAGHTPMIYCPARDGGARVVAPSGMVVGLRLPGADGKFSELLEEHRLALQPGDLVVFYTDGVSEAMNARAELFGEARLRALVAEHAHLDSPALRERILREVEAFVGDADPHDDLTMIVLKVSTVGPVQAAEARAAAGLAAPVARGA
jgi:sigma-B regulation protein RsbU (phosphoserine phosphatase)